MRVVFLIVAVMLAFPVPAFSTAGCDGSSDTVTMLGCANDEFSAADAELNQLYGDLLNHLRQWDQMADTSAITFESRLRQAQRAWIAFRDAECVFRATSMEGGSAQPLIEIGCRAALTKERNAHLLNLIDMFGGAGRNPS